MGDLPPDSRSHNMNPIAAGPALDDQITPLPSSSPHKSSDSSTPFYSQLSTIPQEHHRPDHRLPVENAHYYASQQESSPFKMGAIVGALPDYTSDVQHQTSQSIPRSLSGASTTALVYQLGQNLQMTPHIQGNISAHPSFGSGYGASPYHQGYMPHQSAQNGAYPIYNQNQHRFQGAIPIQNPYQPYQQPSQYMYYPAPFGAQGQYPGGYAVQGTQGQSMFGRRPSLVAASMGIPGQTMEMPHPEGNVPAARAMPGDSMSNAAAFGAPPYQGSGKEHAIPRAFQTVTHLYRYASIYFRQFDSTRSAEETQTIGPCALGGKPAAWNNCSIDERSFLSRCYKGHREPVSYIQKQLRFRQLPNRSFVYCCHAPIPRFALQWSSPCLSATSQLRTCIRSTDRPFRYDCYTTDEPFSTNVTHTG